MTNLEINAAYIGSTEVMHMYLGDELVWGGEPGPDYSKMPLTFNIISGGTISWRATSTAYTKEIQFSVNGGRWVSITSTTAGTPISLNSGDVVQFQGDGAISTGQNATNRFRDSTIVFEVYGNIMSLIDSTGFATATTAADHSFRQLFAAQTGLTSAEHLVLQATTIGANAYKDMFKDCISLAKAPELPATTLSQSSYFGMFQNCTSLTEAPELPATTLAQECYRQMFSGCTSLMIAPSSIGTYASTMSVSGCTSMFFNCIHLTAAPDLPATTLADSCYSEMFRGCTSLTTAPELPATTLAQNCYRSMFNGCRHLITAPISLPATTLAKWCYFYMFEGCTDLTTAPELPATTLENYCYQGMFKGCTSLNYIKCLATDISASSCTTDWVDGVASTGTFVKNASMTGWTTGDNGIPSRWSLEDA